MLFLAGILTWRDGGHPVFGERYILVGTFTEMEHDEAETHAMCNVRIPLGGGCYSRESVSSK